MNSSPNVTSQGPASPHVPRRARSALRAAQPHAPRLIAPASDSGAPGWPTKVLVFALLAQAAMAGRMGAGRQGPPKVQSDLPEPGGPSGYSPEELGIRAPGAGHHRHESPAGGLLRDLLNVAPNVILGKSGGARRFTGDAARTNCEVVREVTSAVRDRSPEEMRIYEGHTTREHEPLTRASVHGDVVAPTLASIWCSDVPAGDNVVRQVVGAMNAGSLGVHGVESPEPGDPRFDEFASGQSPGSILRLPVREALGDSGAPTVPRIPGAEGLMAFVNGPPATGHALEDSQAPSSTFLAAPRHAYDQAMIAGAADPLAAGYAEVEIAVGSPVRRLDRSQIVPASMVLVVPPVPGALAAIDAHAARFPDYFRTRMPGDAAVAAFRARHDIPARPAQPAQQPQATLPGAPSQESSPGLWRASWLFGVGGGLAAIYRVSRVVGWVIGKCTNSRPRRDSEPVEDQGSAAAQPQPPSLSRDERMLRRKRQRGGTHPSGAVSASARKVRDEQREARLRDRKERNAAAGAKAERAQADASLALPRLVAAMQDESLDPGQLEAAMTGALPQDERSVLAQLARKARGDDGQEAASTCARQALDEGRTLHAAAMAHAVLSTAGMNGARMARRLDALGLSYDEITGALKAAAQSRESKQPAEAQEWLTKIERFRHVIVRGEDSAGEHPAMEGPARRDRAARPQRSRADEPQAEPESKRQPMDPRTALETFHFAQSLVDTNDSFGASENNGQDIYIPFGHWNGHLHANKDFLVYKTAAGKHIDLIRGAIPMRQNLQKVRGLLNAGVDGDTIMLAVLDHLEGRDVSIEALQTQLGWG